ncbi:MAG: hypothetical protein ACREKH_10285 [Candidatus Rokuibacteriota bacterium]
MSTAGIVVTTWCVWISGFVAVKLADERWNLSFPTIAVSFVIVVLVAAAVGWVLA